MNRSVLLLYTEFSLLMKGINNNVKMSEWKEEWSHLVDIIILMDNKVRFNTDEFMY